jgi:hypothetical protein
VVSSLKKWRSLNTWEKWQQIKIAFMKNLREDYGWVKLAIIQFRTFYLAAL